MMAVTKMFVRRRQTGITQTNLAKEIGVTQPRISLWERRLQDLPPRRRDQIAQVLDLEPTTLLEDA
jgi:transcriptional regulator with XRE-family HTH domain